MLLAWVPGSDVECTRGVELRVFRLVSGSMLFGRLGQLTVSCGGCCEFALDLSADGEVMWLSYQPGGAQIQVRRSHAGKCSTTAAIRRSLLVRNSSSGVQGSHCQDSVLVDICMGN